MSAERSHSVEEVEPLGAEVGETALALARQTVERDAAAVAAVLPQIGASFLDAVRLLLECPGKVLVSGMGTSGAPAGSRTCSRSAAPRRCSSTRPTACTADSAP
jgi:hypothetical protein